VKDLNTSTLTKPSFRASSTLMLEATQAVLALPVNKWTMNEITAKISSR
jgi:hypothetical protein